MEIEKVFKIALKTTLSKDFLFSLICLVVGFLLGSRAENNVFNHIPTLILAFYLAAFVANFIFTTFKTKNVSK